MATKQRKGRAVRTGAASLFRRREVPEGKLPGPLPAGIGELHRLWMLDLGHNELAALPDDLFTLTGLAGYLQAQPIARVGEQLAQIDGL